MFYEDGNEFKVGAIDHTCLTCGWKPGRKSDTNSRDTRDHLARFHQLAAISYYNLNAKQRYQCAICKYFISERHFNTHQEMHKRESLEVCVENEGSKMVIRLKEVAEEKNMDIDETLSIQDLICSLCKETVLDIELHCIQTHYFEAEYSIEDILECKSELLCFQCNELYTEFQDWKRHFETVHFVKEGLLVDDIEDSSITLAHSPSSVSVVPDLPFIEPVKTVVKPISCTETAISKEPKSSTEIVISKESWPDDTRTRASSESTLINPKGRCLLCYTSQTVYQDLESHRFNFHNLNSFVNFDHLFKQDLGCFSCLVGVRSKQEYVDHLVTVHRVHADVIKILTLL
jgi:hypothetical protein